MRDLRQNKKIADLMKKFQILGTVLLLSVVTILLVACQKEQDGVANEVNSSRVNESIGAVEVNASDIPGIIDRNEAVLAVEL